MNMATLIIDIDNRSNVKKLIEALRSFKGVKHVSLEEDRVYPALDKSIREVQSGQITHCENISELKQSLNL
jgi:hypothetical protein